METGSMVAYYRSEAVGWLKLTVSDAGVRSVSFVPTSREASSGKNVVMERLIDELDRYFEGEPLRFSVALDPQTGTPFQRKVWDELVQIPYGETRSYAQVAAAVGRPRAARAVGLANKNNPIPLIVPCHRVIKADGSIGGYSPGPQVKRTLLALEGVRL